MSCWTKTDEGFTTFASDLEGDFQKTGRIRLQSGKTFANVQSFLEACTPHYTEDEDHELSYWTYKNENGIVATIFND